MEKLELKHLCGYLPYKLKIKRGERILVMNTGQGSSTHWVGISAVLKWFNSEMVSKPIPLLLPLSALTEPLEDGSVPIVELAKIAFGEIEVLDTTQKDGLYAVKFIDEEEDTTVFSYNTNVCSFQADYMDMEELERRITIVSRQLQLFEYLYSKHFDIHNRIPAGLAIDKRTVITSPH